MKDPCSELPNTSAGGATRCAQPGPGGKLSPRGQLRHRALKQITPFHGHCPSGAVGLAARSREGGRQGPVPQPRRAGGAGRCAAAPAPCPTQPAGPPRPGTKHTAPILSAFVAIWQIHVDTANIHLFRHIMSRNREQLELCLLLLLMRMGDRERRREKKSFNYKRYPANYEPYVPIVSKQSNEVHFKSRLLY